MTLADANNTNEILFALSMLVGLVMFASNGPSTLAQERRTKRKQKATSKRTKGKVPKRSNARRRVKTTKAKTRKAPALSASEQVLLTDYFVKRDFKNYNRTSNIPL